MIKKKRRRISALLSDKITLINTKTNSYYIMEKEKDSNTTFKVLMGSLDKNDYGTVQQYNSKLWNTLYKAKIMQGYVDKSELYKGDLKDSTIEDDKNAKNTNEIVALLQTLMNASKNIRKISYGARADVTPKNIKIAQDILSKLADMADNIDTEDFANFITKFNDSLVSILVAFPREDKSWKQLILKLTPKQLANPNINIVRKKINDIITREQEVLDSLYEEALKTGLVKTKYEQILKKMGVRIIVADQELRDIATRAGVPSNCKIWRVENASTKGRYDTSMAAATGKHKREEYLCHGSATSNWISIICRGLTIPREITNGRLRGNGIYLGKFDTARSYVRNATNTNSVFVVLVRARVGVSSRENVNSSGPNIDSYENDWMTVVKKPEQVDIIGLVQIN